MTFVEWLRVRNMLRIVAILLGLLIVLAIVLRISFNSSLTRDDVFISHLQQDPGATVARSTLPDGTPRTTIVDPKQNTTVTIDNYGHRGRHIVITEPRSHTDMHESRVSVGSVKVRQERRGDMEITTIDTDAQTSFAVYVAIADVVAFLIATLLAAPFARENDGHLEFALTKPVSREGYALGVMGVDLAGIVLSSLMTIAALILCQTLFEWPSFDFTGITFDVILMGVVGPFAWYAFLNAVTTSMKRGYGAVLGFAWPVCALVVVFAEIPWGDSLIGQTVHSIFWVVSRIDPLAYLGAIQLNTHSGELTGPPNFGLRLGIDFALFIIYSALAVFQWKRVEA